MALSGVSESTPQGGCLTLGNECGLGILAATVTRVNGSNSHQTGAVAELCPACGLCCNGVLFADVEIQGVDDRKKLRSYGLLLERRGRKILFSQPCECFDGKLCRIYDDRPCRCQTFECRQLQQVQAGDVTATSALRAIKQARHQAEIVRDLVRQLGQKDEHQPLNHRYQQILAEPYDLAGDSKVIRLRSRLLRAVDKLVAIIERDFLT